LRASRGFVVHVFESAMPDFDPNSAECSVYTFKDGLLSAVAHDLKIKVTRFALKVDATTVEGRWDARSLVVDAVMREGREVANGLGQRDRDKIARNIREDVLSADRHPEIVFRSDTVTVLTGASGGNNTATIKGTLTLAGRSQPLSIEAHRDGDRWVAEVVLHQPDFGVKPYSALLGTLKIKPDVKVRVSLAAARLSLPGAS